jgi:lysyl-tRNA synthetase class 2
MNTETMRLRAELRRRVCGFFAERDYLEVDTPLLSPALIPEPSIEVFRTSLESPYRPPRPLFLIPSPEIWMKKLIAGGSGDIFQLCKAFRNWEQEGTVHSGEFTILEWYTMNADYKDSMEITDEFLREMSDLTPDSARKKSVSGPCRRMSMEEACGELAGFDLAACSDRQGMSEAARRLGISYAADDTWEILFNRVFLSLVEPKLPADRPLILYDYPAGIPSLSRRIPGSPWSERWELYIGGIECANCFTEETDPERVESYFRGAAEEKRHAVVPHPADEEFLRLFRSSFPPCSGVALGFDRLLMAISGVPAIGGVIFFPLSDIL